LAGRGAGAGGIDKLRHHQTPPTALNASTPAPRNRRPSVPSPAYIDTPTPRPTRCIDYPPAIAIAHPAATPGHGMRPRLSTTPTSDTRAWGLSAARRARPAPCTCATRRAVCVPTATSPSTQLIWRSLDCGPEHHKRPQADAAEHHAQCLPRDPLRRQTRVRRRQRYRVYTGTVLAVQCHWLC
jgi:hypothetical protein